MFKTKGDQPQWQTIYQQLAGMAIGDTITDEDLFKLLPDTPEPSIRGAFWHAVQEIEDTHKRTFDRVRTIGYRMVEAREHEGLARRQHRKAKRRLRSAQRKAHSADRTLLDPEQRRRLDAVEDHLARQSDMIKRLDARIDKTEERTARAEKDTAELTDRIDALNDLLRRHGIDDDTEDDREA